MSDYVYQGEHLRNDKLQNIHISRLKFYSDGNIDMKAITSQVLARETCIPVQRLMKTVLGDCELKVKVCCRGLPATKGTSEPLLQNHQYVPIFFKSLKPPKHSSRFDSKGSKCHSVHNRKDVTVAYSNICR